MTGTITGTLTIDGTTYNITGVPVTTPPPPSTGLNPIPNRVAGCYWTNWSPLPLGQVDQAYNLIWLFACTCNNDGTVNWGTPSSESAAQFKTDLQAKRAAGVCCIMTVGGSGRQVPLTNRTNSTNFVNSIKSLADSLGGLDGIDLDIEDLADIDATELVWIGEQLKAGIPGFSITWAGSSPNWITNGPPAAKAMTAAGVLDMVGVMCYDWGVSTEAAKETVSEQLITSWVGYVGASRVCIGIQLPNSDDAPGNTFGSYTSALSVWNWALANYPQIRGMDIWTAYEDARASGGSGGTFVSHVIPAVLG